ncbi:MAG: protein kinase [Kiritimatiellae bacterium]|nr:protein kinase [Kiritimatiellia bacterium]MDD5519586.1 protein kinase [Kiritimatiellia bacterium]
MILKSGTILNTVKGASLEITGILSAGKQGTVSKVLNKKTGQIGTVKIFHDDFSDQQTSSRIKYLNSIEVSNLSPVLVGPSDIISNPGIVGYYSAYIPGTQLNEYLKTTKLTLMQRLVLAISFAKGIRALHKNNVADGDIRSENVLVVAENGVSQPYKIDLDNFNTNGTPKPKCIGAEDYMAPELNKAFREGRKRYPDINSDRFSFFISIHEIILLIHPASGFMATDEEYHRAMYEGAWLHDPALPPPKNVKGCSSKMLNARLISLYRRGIGLFPDKRPSVAEWCDELIRALYEIDICRHCHMPSLIDASKTRCYSCGKPYLPPSLLLNSGKIITIDTGSVQVGRSLLGGSMSVSREHALFSRMGPLLFVQSFGANGTWRLTEGVWHRIPDGVVVPLSEGNRIRMADIELRVQ